MNMNDAIRKIQEASLKNAARIRNVVCGNKSQKSIKGML